MARVRPIMQKGIFFFTKYFWVDPKCKESQIAGIYFVINVLLKLPGWKLTFLSAVGGRMFNSFSPPHP